MNRTKINIEANRKLKKLFFNKEIRSCEARLSGCTGNQYLSFAHRHKRRWYYGQEDLLSDFSQVILACISCHQKMEYNQDLTNQIFERQRHEQKTN